MQGRRVWLRDGSQQCFILHMQVVHSGDIICEGIIRIQKEPVKPEPPREEQPAAQTAVEAEPVQDPAAQPLPRADGSSGKAVKPQPKTGGLSQGNDQGGRACSQSLDTKAIWCMSCLQWDP